MSQSAESSFVYVTFIRTTPEKLWSALTDAEPDEGILVRNASQERMEDGSRVANGFP